MFQKNYCDQILSIIFYTHGFLLYIAGAQPGQQKVREHGSGALRKRQTKLRKY